MIFNLAPQKDFERQRKTAFVQGLFSFEKQREIYQIKRR